MAKILAFAGSARKDSWNKKLVICAAEIAKKQGAQVTVVDLQDFPMPIYDGDLEKNVGMPQKAGEFRKLMCEHDGILISSPEYNSEIPPLLKNVIDWSSRPDPSDKKRLMAFNGKVGAVISAAPGSLGGTRVRMSLRGLLSYMGVIVVPEQFGLVNCGSAFDDNGSLSQEVDQQLLIETITRMLNLCRN